MQIFPTTGPVLGSTVSFPKKILIFCGPYERTFCALRFVSNVANVSMLPPPRTFLYPRWYNLFQRGSTSLSNNPKVFFVEKPLLLLPCLKRLFAILFIFLGHTLPMACWWQNVFSILPILMLDLVPIQIFCLFAKDLSLMMSILRILVSCFGKIL